MEDLKEMSAQMMKFQMESQQKIWGKTPTPGRKRRKNLKTRKNNDCSSLNCKNNKKHFFSSQSNNQRSDSTTIFTQNAMWIALEKFSYALDENKSYEAY